MTAVAERTLPHNLDAERSILGAVITSYGHALDSISDTFDGSMFFRDAHKRVYRAMTALYERGDAIDFTTLREELRRAGDLDEVGGPAYVASLADGVPRSTNVEFYARIVKQKAAARDVIYLANRLMTSAYADDRSAVDLVNEAEQGLLAISAQAVPGDLTPAADMVRKLYPVLEAISTERRPVTGLSTGFPSLDRYTRGLQPGNLVLVGARPSSGKSTIAAQIALHVASSKPVAFFSIEMSEQEQAFRILATLAEVDGHLLQAGQLPMHDQVRLGDAMADFAGRHLWLDESGTISALQIRSKSRRMKARHGLGLIVVDYLQLLQHPKSESREQAVASSGRLLKQIARELAVPVIALCQLSRAVEQRQDQRPKLSDLRESGSLEQDCDVALLIHRPAPKDEGGITVTPPTELIIAKSRNGPTTSIDLRWLGEQYRFVEIE